MRNPKDILENLDKQSAKHKNNDKFKFNELYKHFNNPKFYTHVYTQLYTNRGSDISGMDGKTKINAIIELMKDEAYQPKSVKKVPIQNSNGKKKPLGKPSMTDRYIQEIVKEILTTIYAPLFSEESYGFPQGKSCHNAIHAIQTTFQGTLWFVEGHIEAFFESIDHHVMIEILRKKIDDERFIRLIWKFLKAGYLEDWKFNKTYSGAPVGGIISPILANIYLNELDKYIKKLQHDFNNGSANKKLCYVRYAGNFVLGVIGSREEAENIKKNIGSFFSQKLKLQLSQEKTLITHSSKKARFLSYEISVYQRGIIRKVKNPKTGTLELTSKGKGQIKITMPRDIIIKKFKELKVVEDLNARPWKARRNTKIIQNSDLEIIEIYNEQIRGLYNYFRLASNVSLELNKFYQIMKWSMFHTFASKYKSTIPKMLRKYRIGDTNDFGVPYMTEQGQQIMKFYHDGFTKNQYMSSKTHNDNMEDYIPNMYKYMIYG